MIEEKKFRKNDAEFICLNCKRKVARLGYTSRDHCPYCLYSRHVDVFPGDRSSTCQGLMEPIDLEKFRDTFKIIYRCQKCGMIHKNIVASDDDMDALIEVSKKE